MGSDPITSGPRSLPTSLATRLVALVSRRTGYLQLSPAIQKCLLVNLLTILIFHPSIEFFAIGLLVPQPCLIVQLLAHQRKLPYWCTKV